MIRPSHCNKSVYGHKCQLCVVFPLSCPTIFGEEIARESCPQNGKRAPRTNCGARCISAGGGGKQPTGGVQPLVLAPCSEPCLCSGGEASGITKGVCQSVVYFLVKAESMLHNSLRFHVTNFLNDKGLPCKFESERMESEHPSPTLQHTRK